MSLLLKTEFRMLGFLEPRSLTGLHLWGGAHETFLNTQIAQESRVRVVDRGEDYITGYQPNIYA